MKDALIVIGIREGSFHFQVHVNNREDFGSVCSSVLQKSDHSYVTLMRGKKRTIAFLFQKNPVYFILSVNIWKS